METFIKRRLKGSQMEQLFNDHGSDIRFYSAVGLSDSRIYSSNDIYTFKIKIRHNEEEDAGKLFDEIRKKTFSKIRKQTNFDQICKDYENWVNQKYNDRYLKPALSKGQIIALETVLVHVDRDKTLDQYIDLIEREGELTLCTMFENTDTTELVKYILDLSESIDNLESTK